MVDIGEFVSPGTEIVTLQNLSPIYTDFTLPERFMSALRPQQTIEVEVAAFPGEMFTGTVTAISPKVDQMTRTVRLQATLENKDRRLRPGMFASIDVVTGTGSDVVTVPRTAVTFYPYGDSAFVINGDGDDLTVERRQIKTGRVRAGQIEILSGLQAGDRVVSAGQLKLRTGQKIRIDNSIALPENVTGP